MTHSEQLVSSDLCYQWETSSDFIGYWVLGAYQYGHYANVLIFVIAVLVYARHNKKHKNKVGFIVSI